MKNKEKSCVENVYRKTLLRFRRCIDRTCPSFVVWLLLYPTIKETEETRVDDRRSTRERREREPKRSAFFDAHRESITRDKSKVLRFKSLCEKRVTQITPMLPWQPLNIAKYNRCTKARLSVDATSLRALMDETLGGKLLSSETLRG